MAVSQSFAQRISFIQYPNEVIRGEKFAVKLDVLAEPDDTILVILSTDGEISLSESYLIRDSIINIEPAKLNQFLNIRNNLPRGFIGKRTLLFVDTLIHSSALRSYVFVANAKSIGEVGLKFLPVKFTVDSLIFDPAELEKAQINIRVKNYIEKTAGLCVRFEKDGFIRFNVNEKFSAKNGFTLSFWLRTTAMRGRIISIRSGIDRSFMTVGLKAGSIFLAMSNSIGKYEITLPKFVNDGDWHNVLIIASGSENVLKFYIDGEKIEEIFIPNLSQFEVNRPTIRLENVSIDEVVMFKARKSELVQRLPRYFVKVDSDIFFFLKFENETINIIGNVSNLEHNGVKFVPSSVPICSPEIKISAEMKGNNITIIWEIEDPAFVDKFIVERKIRDETFQPVYQVSSSDQKKYVFVDNAVENNAVYYYRVRRINKDGSSEYSDEVKIGIGLNKDFEIIGNFPNPFNSETKIIYHLFNDTYVRLIVYDIVGREIAVLVDGFQSAGRKEVLFNLGNVKTNEMTSGIYFYKLQTQRGYEVRKMIVIK
ncbi:MAG: LamG-like jellyroll fold domain-containing protein [Candidatus Kryptonium sp.]